nr:stability determinant [Halomonas socia]
MTTPLSPIVSEFETEEQAASYERWLREKVAKSLANPGPGVPHDEVMAQMDAIIDEAERRCNENT